MNKVTLGSMRSILYIHITIISIGDHYIAENIKNTVAATACVVC